MNKKFQLKISTMLACLVHYRLGKVLWSNQHSCRFGYQHSRSLTFGTRRRRSACRRSIFLNQLEQQIFFLARKRFPKQPLIGIASLGSSHIRAHNTFRFVYYINMGRMMVFLLVVSRVVDENAKWLFVSCLEYQSHEVRIMSAVAAWH